MNFKENNYKIIRGVVSKELSEFLSNYLSLKKAPDRIDILKGLYEEEFRRAADTDEDRVSVQISPALRSYTS